MDIEKVQKKKLEWLFTPDADTLMQRLFTNLSDWFLSSERTRLVAGPASHDGVGGNRKL